MDFSALFKRAGKTAAENSPALLTAIAVTGTLTTAYLAARAAFKASEDLRDYNEAHKISQQYAEDGESNGVMYNDTENLDLKAQFNITWKYYIPAAASAILTVSAIIGANQIADRRTAAMASAYTFTSQAYAEYKNKTREKIGKTKEQAIRDEVAQDTVDKNPMGKAKVVATGNGASLCYDAWSGRYFNSDIETLRRAVNDFNAKVIAETYVSLSEFWHLIGLEATSVSDDVGWNTDKLMEAEYPIVTVGSEPCVYFNFTVMPLHRYTDNF